MEGTYFQDRGDCVTGDCLDFVECHVSTGVVYDLEAWQPSGYAPVAECARRVAEPDITNTPTLPHVH